MKKEISKKKIDTYYHYMRCVRGVVGGTHIFDGIRSGLRFARQIGNRKPEFRTTFVDWSASSGFGIGNRIFDVDFVDSCREYNKTYIHGICST